MLLVLNQLQIAMSDCLPRGAAMADATKAEFRAILEKYIMIDLRNLVNGSS